MTAEARAGEEGARAAQAVKDAQDSLKREADAYKTCNQQVENAVQQERAAQAARQSNEKTGWETENAALGTSVRASYKTIDERNAKYEELLSRYEALQTKCAKLEAQSVDAAKAAELARAEIEKAKLDADVRKEDIKASKEVVERLIDGGMELMPLLKGMLERYIGGRLEQAHKTALGACKLPGKLPPGASNTPATNPSMPEEVSRIVDAFTQEVVDAFKSLAVLSRAQIALVLADSGWLVAGGGAGHPVFQQFAQEIGQERVKRIIGYIKAIKDSARSPEPTAPDPAAPEAAMG